MKNSPYSLATDTSNDKKDKLFLLVVKIQNCGEVRNEQFSIAECEGRVTGKNISKMLLQSLEVRGVPLENCVAITTYNTNVMVGKKTGLWKTEGRKFRVIFEWMHLSLATFSGSMGSSGTAHECQWLLYWHLLLHREEYNLSEVISRLSGIVRDSNTQCV